MTLSTPNHGENVIFADWSEWRLHQLTIVSEISKGNLKISQIAKQFVAAICWDNFPGSKLIYEKNYFFNYSFINN
jgi:hypothetical protein